ncbi:signal peptide peptidase SppA [Halobacillus yeomjeoni]|uniref:Signal peptide peptidase SppA n=1 Tax=Halobacillus yeomjeoni TaxID=311194 RepID=A0A931MUM2_9BACI|nr:signal peptide peptidase SppA [Halobacillus yeomjeoni]MBH0229680.1 signal peptide peptidase SppA [Halobacillus yeomjeoni]MCA0982928.1 signal peptide peptidase SppA [Halobacillus yeomjeoni]
MTKRIVAIIIAAALLLVALTFQSINFFINQDFSENNPAKMFSGKQQLGEKVIEEGSEMSRIARINIEGAIINTPGSSSNPFGGGGYQHDHIMKQLQQVKEDNTIKALLLYVNSPGGGVYESAEIHDKLKEIKKAGKPIFVSMGSIAASGGYYISTPADQIFASQETFTGSLGVIMESINYQELANEYGVKFNTFKSGKFKDIMSPVREMTETEREIIQELVDESYEQFVDVIVEGRELPEEKVYDLADGRIYSGSQAVENGLIDQIGFREDALKALKDKVGGDPKVIEFRNNIGSFFDLPLAQNFMPNSEIRYIEKLISQRQGPTLMYMYSE